MLSSYFRLFSSVCVAHINPNVVFLLIRKEKSVGRNLRRITTVPRINNDMMDTSISSSHACCNLTHAPRGLARLAAAEEMDRPSMCAQLPKRLDRPSIQRGSQQAILQFGAYDSAFNMLAEMRALHGVPGSSSAAFADVERPAPLLCVTGGATFVTDRMIGTKDVSLSTCGRLERISPGFCSCLQWDCCQSRMSTRPVLQCCMTSGSQETLQLNASTFLT